MSPKTYLLPWTLLYVNDVVLVTDTAINLQKNLNTWRHTLEKYGLRVGKSNTEYLKCPFSATLKNICIGTISIPAVNKFRYLGSTLTTDANVDADVTHRINVA